MPKSLRREPTPNNKTDTTIMWGPLALAADHGPRREGRATRAAVSLVLVLVAGDRPVTTWVVANGAPGDFRVQQVARIPMEDTPPGNLSLTPFYRTHRRVYGLYFVVFFLGVFLVRVALF